MKFDFQTADTYRELAEDRLKQFYSPRGVGEFVLADAESRLRARGASHAIWRGERCYGRLAAMEPDVDRRELIVGCPAFNHEPASLAGEAAGAYEDMPPWPGGDNGHINPDYKRLLDLGLRDLGGYIRACAEANGPSDFYTGCERALAGIGEYIRKTARKCRELGMQDQAENCESIISEPPHNFYQALQLLFFAQVCIWYGEDHNLVTCCRLDRSLIDFYLRDTAKGVLTPDKAFDLLCHYYLQLNNICAPGLALSVIVGGPDAEGYVCNDITYLAVAARVRTRLVYPTIGLAWTPDAPEELMDFCCRLELEGVGCPSFFNDSVIHQGLVNNGVSDADAREWMNSTCVEIMPAGCANVYVASPYFNCSQALLDVLKEARNDPPADTEELIGRYFAELDKQVGGAAAAMDGAWEARKQWGLEPLVSCFTRDCLETGRDYDCEGARYNWVENSFVGTANVADAIYAVDRLVFKEKRIDFTGLYAALEADFKGYESLLSYILSLPKYGNDDDEVDGIAGRLFGREAELSRSYTVGGHEYVPGTFCWIQHALLGSRTMATPDGRRAGTAFADGAGSAQGRDIKGPTASIKSTTKWDHTPMIGGLVQNIKFSKDNLSSDRAAASLKALVKAYLLRGGMEIQVNITSLEELKDAQAHPERHGDLIVRVAGYSDYFVNLPPNMQDEVIRRKEHSLC